MIMIDLDKYRDGGRLTDIVVLILILINPAS
jgi:hypothetical protein